MKARHDCCSVVLQRAYRLFGQVLLLPFQYLAFWFHAKYYCAVEFLLEAAMGKLQPLGPREPTEKRAQGTNTSEPTKV